MKTVNYIPEHLEQLVLQPHQAMLQPLLADPEYRSSLFHAGPAISIVDGDVVIASMGLIKEWEGRATAWALLSLDAAKHLVYITKAIKRALQIHAYRRVETTVLTHFEEGHRWAHLLGFLNEGTMHAYTPQGDDCDLYARVNWGIHVY